MNDMKFFLLNFSNLTTVSSNRTIPDLADNVNETYSAVQRVGKSNELWLNQSAFNNIEN